VLFILNYNEKLEIKKSLLNYMFNFFNLKFYYVVMFEKSDLY